jgi:predicted transposase/invertase (TIGR01784 family)
MARLNPGIDIAFKKIFGVEENKDLLMSLINAIVGPHDQVFDLTLMNPYNLQSFRTDKLSIMDIKAKGHDGTLFNIEIQITDEGNYNERALLYWSKMYAEQMRKGDGYGVLSKAIGIHILNFDSIDDDRYHHEFQIQDRETNERHFNHFEMHTLELSKFSSKNDQLTDLVKRIRTSLDVWMAFLSRNELLIKGHLPPELDTAHVNKAIDILDVLNLSDEEREAYEGREKLYWIEASALIHQHALGVEKGMELGREEGEAIATQKMVSAMIQNGIDDATIMACAKITAEELDDIRSSLI